MTSWNLNRNLEYSAIIYNSQKMKLKHYQNLLLVLIVAISCSNKEDDLTDPLTYPSFGSEVEVTITGLSFDAMEPFISQDG